jgi:hypothetical protein
MGSRVYGRARTEMKADSIALKLVRVLEMIESYQDDPEKIFDSAKDRATVLGNKGVSESLLHVRRHYLLTG